MKAAALRLEAVEVRRSKKTVLQIPHLSIENGEVLAVIGPNGAGKSTLLQVLALLEKPSRGRVFLNDQEVTPRSNLVSLRRHLALVFQESLLFRGSVFDNVTLGLRIRGVSKRESKQRAEYWLAKLNIDTLAPRSVTKLSAGEAQRVNLARSLVLNPEVFLLDEPFASLDPPTRTSLIEDMQHVLAETKVTAVFVTHDRAEALMIGERLAVMVDGRIVQMDTPEAVFARPATAEVAAFMGVENILEGRVLSGANGRSLVQVGDHQITTEETHVPGSELLICLRSEDITVSLPSEDGDLNSKPNVMKGRITRLGPLGAQCRVVVDCSVPLTALIPKQVFVGLSLSTGSEVLLTFKPRDVHAISMSRPTSVAENAT